MAANILLLKLIGHLPFCIINNMNLALKVLPMPLTLCIFLVISGVGARAVIGQDDVIDDDDDSNRGDLTLRDGFAASNSGNMFSHVVKRSSDIPEHYQEQCGDWQICDNRIQHCAKEIGVPQCELCTADVCNFGPGGKDLFQNPREQKDCQNKCPVFWKNNFYCEVASKECALVPGATVDQLEETKLSLESEIAALKAQNKSLWIAVACLSVFAVIILLVIVRASFRMDKMYSIIQSTRTKLYQKWMQIWGLRSLPTLPQTENLNLLQGSQANSHDDLPSTQAVQDSGNSSLSGLDTSETSLPRQSSAADEAGPPTSGPPYVSLATSPEKRGAPVVCKPEEDAQHNVPQTAKRSDGSVLRTDGARPTPFTGLPAIDQHQQAGPHSSVPHYGLHSFPGSSTANSSTALLRNNKGQGQQTDVKEVDS